MIIAKLKTQKQNVSIQIIDLLTKKMLRSLQLLHWTTGGVHYDVLYNVVEDHSAGPELCEPLPASSECFGSESTTLWRLLSTFGVMHHYKKDYLLNLCHTGSN